jgi:2-C-methyl-D-erythritol 4-phosphate cytidylyltransferase
MDRARLLARLDEKWRDFTGSFEGLTDAQMVEPGVTRAWSVKDILAHVSTWEEEALKYLPVILDGRRPPRYSTLHGGIDAFNAKMTGAKAALAVSEALHQLDQTHRRLVAFLGQAPEEELATDTRFRRRLRADTYGHYPKHTKAIRAWRESSPAASR